MRQCTRPHPCKFIFIMSNLRKLVYLRISPSWLHSNPFYSFHTLFFPLGRFLLFLADALAVIGSSRVGWCCFPAHSIPCFQSDAARSKLKLMLVKCNNITVFQSIKWILIVINEVKADTCNSCQCEELNWQYWARIQHRWLMLWCDCDVGDIKTRFFKSINIDVRSHIIWIYVLHFAHTHTHRVVHGSETSRNLRDLILDAFRYACRAFLSLRRCCSRNRWTLALHV